MLESPDPSLVPLSCLSTLLLLGDRISFNEFKDHPTLTSTKIAISQQDLLNSRLIKPSIYLPCPRYRHLRLSSELNLRLNWTEQTPQAQHVLNWWLNFPPNVLLLPQFSPSQPMVTLSFQLGVILGSLPSLWFTHTYLVSLPANPVCSTFQMYLEISIFITFPASIYILSSFLLIKQQHPCWSH